MRCEGEIRPRLWNAGVWRVLLWRKSRTGKDRILRILICGKSRRGGRMNRNMDTYKEKYIDLIESYLRDREGSRKHISDAIYMLMEDGCEMVDGIDAVIMKRKFAVNLFPLNTGASPSDPVFAAVMDLEAVQRQIQTEVEKRKDLVSCFALVLILFRRIDTSYLLLDLKTRQMISRVYFDKVKAYLLKKEFCYGKERIDRIIREGIEEIYESVHSPVYDHAVNMIMR